MCLCGGDDKDAENCLVVRVEEESLFEMSSTPSSFEVLFLICCALFFVSTDAAPSTDLPGGIKFAVIGQYGMAAAPGNHEADVLTGIIQVWNPSFILTVGGNNLPNGNPNTLDENVGQYYHSYIGGYSGSYGQGRPLQNNSFFPAVGYEDWLDGTVTYRKFFPFLGESYVNPSNPHPHYDPSKNGRLFYEFVRGAVHFFALDSSRANPAGATADSSQGQWLRDALSRSTSPHRVVYFDAAPFSSCRWDNITQGATWMRWPYAAWGATLVLSGNHRMYERLQVDSFPYVINGIGGAPNLEPLGPPISGSVLTYNGSWGAVLISANENEMRVQVQAIDLTVVDTFSVKPYVPRIVAVPASVASQVVGAILVLLSVAMMGSFVTMVKRLHKAEYFVPPTTVEGGANEMMTTSHQVTAKGPTSSEAAHQMSRLYNDDADDELEKKQEEQRRSAGNSTLNVALVDQ